MTNNRRYAIINIESEREVIIMEKGGISFSSLLFIILLVLKLVKVISISWVWVFAPLWIPLGIGLVLLIIAIIIGKHQKER